MRYSAIITLCLFSYCIAHATTWNVGPTRAYTFCSQVVSLVQDGDSILIDFSTYINDPQVQWTKNNLYIAGVGGRPRLEAGNIIANDMSNGKGIFVIKGANVHVHNIEFANAVVQDNNGAGIRQEGANLWISNCLFNGNEMGILGGNIPDCKTTIEYCEFVNSGSPANPGYQHNIYINHIDTLVFRYNYTHNSIAEGHELKSRATYNFILYNRIANEDSEDSRTIDLPNGGTSVIVGNIIEQGPNSANSNLLGYGLEGLSNPSPHALYCTSNTFINKKTTGSFIQVANGTDTLYVKNNIFAGPKTGGLFIGTPIVLDSSNNEINNSIDAIGFVDASGYDYHLEPTSVVVDKGIGISKTVHGYSLHPLLSYVDTCNFETRKLFGSVDIGAFEFEFPVATIENEFPGISIFPNPVNEFLYIHLKDIGHADAFLKIINISGETLLTQRIQEGENSINVAGWSSGVYFAGILLGSRMEFRRIVVI